MEYIHYHSQPELRDPVAVVALGGWNDAADSATTAIKFLIDRWKPTKFAEIDIEEFFVFTETRPTIKYVDGIQRSIIWPSGQFLGRRLAPASSMCAKSFMSQRWSYWVLCLPTSPTQYLYPSQVPHRILI